MKTCLALLLLLCCTIQLHAQKPEQLGYKPFTIKDGKLGEVHYYVSQKNIDKPLGILLYIDGSGAFPLFQHTARGTMSTIPLDMQAMGDKYHVIIISKPGVPFIDSVQRDPVTGAPTYNAPQEYTQRLSLQWRADAADAVLKDAMKQIPCNKAHIAIMGISEGFQVGAKLLGMNKSITHALLYVGNGLSQLYDFTQQQRADAIAGKITHEQAQQNIDSIAQVFKDILTHPDATDKEWYGHTYKRWSSFGSYVPASDILKTNIPLYIVAAMKDHNSSIAGTDYLYIESIRQGKKNIDFKFYPYDHYFNEYGEDGKPTGNHTLDVVNEGIAWLEKH